MLFHKLPLIDTSFEVGNDSANSRNPPHTCDIAPLEHPLSLALSLVKASNTDSIDCKTVLCLF